MPEKTRVTTEELILHMTTLAGSVDRLPPSFEALMNFTAAMAAIAVYQEPRARHQFARFLKTHGQQIQWYLQKYDTGFLLPAHPTIN